jgi:leucyl aminopeptidase
LLTVPPKLDRHGQQSVNARHPLNSYKPAPMTDLPLLDSSAEGAIPIESIRAADWPRWAESHAAPLRTLAAAVDFRGQPGRLLLAPSTDGRLERVLFGLGDRPSPMLYGVLGAQLPAGDYRLANGARDFNATLIAIAWALVGYAFARYKPRALRSTRLM